MNYEEQYKIITRRIFNNWSALQLAVENGMGGRDRVKVAIEIMDYMYQYCIGNQNIAVSELVDILEEMMDQEFDTVCDDGSIAEVSSCLLDFLHLCRQGKHNEIELKLNQLPNKTEWLRPDVQINYAPKNPEDTSSSEEEEESDDHSMDVDHNEPQERVQATPDPDGWITVTTKRKK